MLKSFSGFRGAAALVKIGEIAFVVVARDVEQLAIIYSAILPEAAPFNPDACKKSIVISSSTLPEPKPHEQVDKSSEA